MKKISFLFIAIILFTIGKGATGAPLKLWYNQPAKTWNEALPLGNGRLGAMVYGNPAKEEIQLNENTLYSGSPNRNDNTDAKAALPEVRRLIFEGKYKEAQDLANEKIITKTSHGAAYQTIGSLRLNFEGHGNYSDFYRDLDIEKAVATTIYKAGGVTYKREVFTSFPDQVVVIRLTANQKGAISFSATMNRPSPVDLSTEGNNVLKMEGISSDHETVKGGVKFQSRLKIVPEGGNVEAVNQSLVVTKANSVLLFVSMATSFVNYNDISADANKRAIDYLTKAEKKKYDQLLSDHISFYQKLFNRVSLDLGQTDSIKNPTDVRIEQFAKGNDPSMATLYFQFGRYLLISSSQPGQQPANLQGLWGNQLFASWDSKYTININTEMNYWPAEPTNLAEMHEPLIQMVKELSVAGQKTAADMYGANGWVAHHNTDVWRICGPIDGSYWGMWPMGGVWLSQHLWEKYAFNGDLDYLRSVYPAMKGAAEFCLSFLTPEPDHGWLVITPSVSPENSPSCHPESSISAGTTLDNQLVFDLLSKTAEAARLLKMDADFVKRLNETIEKLPPMQIGQYNQLQEWMYDWDNPDDHHRHVSHLYGAFPSNQISPYHTPELYEATRNSLIYRGDPSTGWSMNWKINLWARLLDGNHAYKLMTDQIKLVGAKREDGRSFNEDGGTYPNMFDAHPPFQIDGNFGFTSGLTEMLVQSQDGAIHILPALPDNWPTGSVKGIRARGGFEIEEMEWKDGKITKLIIQSNLGGNCRIRSYWPLKGEDGTTLSKAEGDNSNSFYQIPGIKKPRISEKAKLVKHDLNTIYEYDIETRPEQKICLVQNTKM
ncbi:MAG TPA: glycoside hydrolase family 95 protein [Prolixibacteraceae bacterium]|nr:glycoside hydrolase family 95 protein [Prolixibacteraceae bacterium]